MRYEQIRDTTLPWGYWLRVRSGPGSIEFVDEDGRLWPSVRAAFWEGRLGMPRGNHRIRDEQLEIMLAMLAIKDRKRRDHLEIRQDMFSGCAGYQRLYGYWLYTTGLVTGGHDHDPLDSQTTDEGRAVIAMLLGTRTPELHQAHLGRESVRIITETVDVNPIDQDRLRHVEEQAVHLTYGFLRDRMGSCPMIVLQHRARDGLMPVARTIWSQGFGDEVTRDAFYGWLVERSDRWDAWGAIAYKSGGAALTQHLLALLAACLPRDDGIGIIPQLPAPSSSEAQERRP